MQLVPWSFHTQFGFTLRGYHSVPSGKPVLHILHGNGFCSKIYLPMLSVLAEQFDLFLSDAQGHGDSDHGGPFVGWNASAELAGQAWQAHNSLFGEVKVYGVGHSFGGVLTALLHSEPSSPFEQAVLLDPVLFTPTMLTVMRSLNAVRLYHKNPLAKAALRRRQHWPDKASGQHYFNNRGMFKNWHPDALAAYIDHALKPTEQGLSLKCLPEREAEIFASFPQQLWPKLNKTQAAVTVLYGASSYPFIEKALTKWQKNCSALALIKVTGGHCFMQEYPVQTANKIKCLLTQTSS